MKLVAEGLPHVQNGRRIFLTSWFRIPEREPIAGRLATVAKVRLFLRHCRHRRINGANGRQFLRFGGIFAGLGPSLFCDFGLQRSATETSAVALTAAKASASPAPKRSSRPGESRSRAVAVRIARSSRGVSAELRSSIRAQASWPLCQTSDLGSSTKRTPCGAKAPRPRDRRSSRFAACLSGGPPRPSSWERRRIAAETCRLGRRQ
jgi:hypothetical protein